MSGAAGVHAGSEDGEDVATWTRPSKVALVLSPGLRELFRLLRWDLELLVGKVERAAVFVAIDPAAQVGE